MEGTRDLRRMGGNSAGYTSGRGDASDWVPSGMVTE